MKYILSVISVLYAVLIITNPAAVSEAVKGSISACLEIIIPSLFSFTMLSVYLQQSGLYRTALKPLTLPLSKLLRLPEELCAVFLLGNIGGYPVGAKLVSSLLSEGRITRADTGRLMCFCYGSGPSFIISIAGMRIFRSAAAGAVLFTAALLSNLIIALLVCRRGKPIEISPKSEKADLSAGCFINSVMASARVMFTVCAVIVGFAVISATSDISGLSGLIASLFEALCFGENSSAVFPAFLEVSRVSALLPTGVEVFPLVSALLSFGGVCVVMQIFALTSGKLPLKGFLASRLPAMALSGLFSLFGALLPETAVETMSPAPAYQLFSVNSGMSVCLLIMCGILLSTAHGEKKD